MKVDIKELPRAQSEISVELTPEEYDPFLKKAAFFVSEKMNISGFRPGKAPYEVIKQQIGEAKLWEEALEPAVKKTLFSALNDNHITTVGSPKIDVVKLAPGNPVQYKATVNRMPSIERLTLEGFHVERKAVSVPQEQVDRTLLDLQKMRAKEKLVYREARAKDKVEVDFTIFLDNVPIEGGDGKRMPVVLGENRFIPGFEEKVAGMKSGDEKEFQLTFPKQYYQKNIAGRLVDFKVKVFSVYEIELPEVTDEFAKNLKFENAESLKKQIHGNLEAEGKIKEERRVEDEIIEKLLEKNRFSDIPDILIQSETQSLFEEFEKGIREDGLSFEDYLQHIRKTREQFLLDFVPTAVKRIKTALLFREIAGHNQIEISENDIDAYIAEGKIMRASGSKTHDTIHKPEYREYLRNTLMTRKVMDFLKQKFVR